MFPGVDGFHWSATHIIFLSAFGMVLTTLLVTLTIAAFRTVRSIRGGQATAIAWHADFEDLPLNERRCRHAFDGSAPDRICNRGFDCRECETHPKLVAMRSESMDDDLSARLYHRGHTWVLPQTDGTALIGLDELGSRVIGMPDMVTLPASGTKLTLNGPAWEMTRQDHRIVVRSPLDCEVIENGDPECEWLLRVKVAPHPAPYRHLLSGLEADRWIGSETDRLLNMTTGGSVGTVLADGGALVSDLRGALPEAPWDEISSAIFLNT
jgi:hypothetical protein